MFKKKVSHFLGDIEIKISYLLRNIGLLLIRMADKLEKQKHSDEHILIIDRDIDPLDTEKFIGSIWSIIDAEENKTSLSISEIDCDKASFESCLEPNETDITGEEKLIRHANAGHILADIKIGKVLYEEKNQKTLEYFYQEKGVTWFELQGTVLLNSSQDRYVMYLVRYNNGRWHRHYRWLGLKRDVSNPSLILAND